MVDLIFEQSLNCQANPPTPTGVRTPGQPVALTRGFLKPVTIPIHVPTHVFMKKEKRKARWNLPSISSLFSEYM